MQYRKKAMVVDVVQWDGKFETVRKIVSWMTVKGLEIDRTEEPPTLTVPTVSGDATAIIGDWIVRDSQGDVYYCTPESFALNYEAVDQDTFDFGAALKHLREGKRVARNGWNGKGMWLAYQKAYPDGIPINKNTAEATGIPEGTVCRFLPYLTMKTADGSFVPWLASQTDVLANDWTVLE